MVQVHGESTNRIYLPKQDDALEVSIHLHKGKITIIGSNIFLNCVRLLEMELEKKKVQVSPVLILQFTCYVSHCHSTLHTQDELTSLWSQAIEKFQFTIHTQYNAAHNFAHSIIKKIEADFYAEFEKFRESGVIQCDNFLNRPVLVPVDYIEYPKEGSIVTDILDDICRQLSQSTVFSWLVRPWTVSGPITVTLICVF